MWPQTLHVLLGRERGDTLVTVELGAEPARIAGVAGPGFSVTCSPTGPASSTASSCSTTRASATSPTTYPRSSRARPRRGLGDPLGPGARACRVTPERFLDLAIRALPQETDELILGRVLGYASGAFWDFLAPETRAARAPEFEAVLWAGVTGSRPATARSAFFSTWRGVATTPDAVARLRRLWEGDEELPGLPLSENDQTALASGLALREVDGWAGDPRRPGSAHHDPRPQGPLPVRAAFAGRRPRGARGVLPVPSRSGQPCPGALGPLRARQPAPPTPGRASSPFIRPALDMIEEIQRTGDIFFPGNWLGATLGGHGEVEAAETVGVPGRTARPPAAPQGEGAPVRRRRVAGGGHPARVGGPGG